MKCPKCGSANDGHSAVDNAEASPKPGDVSVCLYCRALGVFTDDGIRLATDEEHVGFLLSDIDAQVKRAVQIARLYEITIGRRKE